MANGRICMAADVSSLAMTPDLGAEVRGIDLNSPLSDACFSRILEIFYRYGVIFFRAQQLDPQHLLRFASRFGEIDIHQGAEQFVIGLPQVSVLSNAGRENRSNGVHRDGLHWHSDLSYKPLPALATLQFGIDCPSLGGNTEFVNMYAAFEALPAQRRTFLEKLRAVHDRNFRYTEIHPGRTPPSEQDRASPPPAEHPLVRVHPVTGRKSLFIAKDVVSHILGMEPAESRKLIDELERFSTQPRFVYSHRWRVGDLVVWDNRCTMHRTTAFDNKFNRTMHRVHVRGDAPIAA